MHRSNKHTAEGFEKLPSAAAGVLLIAGVLLAAYRGLLPVAENRYVSQGLFSLAFETFRERAFSLPVPMAPALVICAAGILVLHAFLRAHLHERTRADFLALVLSCSAVPPIIVIAAGLWLRRQVWCPSIYSPLGIFASGLLLLLSLVPGWIARARPESFRSACARLAGRPIVRRSSPLAAGLMLLALIAVPVTVAYLRLAWGGRPKMNFLFLTIDTLRADHLGVYGYPRNTSPHIDRLAAESVLFTDAIVQWPKTSPSFASFMTSTYGRSNGVLRVAPHPVGDRLTLLAEMLRNRGYRTAAVVTNGCLGKAYGFGQGFQTYREVWSNCAVPEPRRQSAEMVAEQSIDWLRKHEREGGFFLWVHFSDPHSQYVPPPPFHEMYVGDSFYEGVWRAPVLPGTTEDMYGVPSWAALGECTDVDYYIAEYDAEIRFMDHHIGRLLREARDLGLLENTLVILVSDHGESLGENGYYFAHGRLPYDTCSRVPLLIRPPSARPVGRVIDRTVELVDLVPTALDLLGLPGFKGIQGTSLASLLRGDPTGLPPYAFTETGYAEEHTRVVRNGRWKLIYAPSKEDRAVMRGVEFELYDLKGDPAELRNVAADEPARTDSLRAALFAWMGEGAGPTAEPHPRREIDAETEAGLRALGYVP